MPRPVSVSWLQAEVQGFPFASMAAFGEGLVVLERVDVGVLSGATARVAVALEQHLRVRSGGMSLDVLRQLRDAAWFDAGHKKMQLGEHLAGIAGSMLALAGDRVVLRVDGDPAELATRWRWLSLVLPSDLLIAALAAASGREPPADTVSLVTPHLAEVLRDPCAETHLHVGAAVPFGLLWTGLARILADAPPRPSELTREPGVPPPFGGPRELLSMLSAAMIGRTLLAAFLERVELGRSRGGDPGFGGFLDVELAAIAARLDWAWGEGAARTQLVRALRQLRGRGSMLSLPLLTALYRRLVGPAAARGGAIDAVVQRDPLAAWLGMERGRGLPESRFACRALAYLAREGHDDRWFAVHFWQYQRVRCLLYRYLVEEPGTAGLDWFTRHFARISPLRAALESAKYASALEVQSRSLHLAALEARTAPAARWVDVRDEVRALAKQAVSFEPGPGARARPEVGLVLHFIKAWTRSVAGRTALQADPHNGFGCRYGPWFFERWQQATAIATALRHHPDLLVVLRAIDVANVELAEPTWVIAPLFEIARRASEQASARLARRSRNWRIPPLRATVHVGEDFRRLVEGIRRVHETVDVGLVRCGDRIGHGIALAEDPKRWAEAARVVAQPAEDRLDDLLWELDRYRRGDLAADTGRLELVRGQVLDLARFIYRGEGRGTDIEDLLEARRRRHQSRVLRRFGFPFVRSAPSDSADRLLWSYLMDRDVYRRGQRPIEVTMDAGEVAMLGAAQRWLRGLLGRLEITVESNPSSNLLIADYLAIEEHPAFRLQPLPSAPEPTRGAVLLSVNTDNPITFASCLADELSHVYYALLRLGVCAQDALAWIDRVRENGYRSRFTLAESADLRILRRVANLPPDDTESAPRRHQDSHLWARRHARDAG